MATFTTDQLQLVFDEEFDRDQLAGGSILWNTTMPGGYRNVGSTGEKQLYLDDNTTTLSNGTVLNIDPFTFADGVMTITANPTPADQLTAALNYKWTSGLISSSAEFEYRYGYTEIRAQMPVGKGLWPAYWLRWADSGRATEIDIFEILGQSPNFLNSTVHWNDGTGDYMDKTVRSTVTNLSTGFHTYGMNWTESAVTFYLDGVQMGQMKTPAVMTTSMYVIANLALGGWPGLPDATTPFPAEFKVDYIRVWQDAAAMAPRVLTGTDGAETLSGGDGADTMRGLEGNDSLYGGRGNDHLLGGVGNDRMLGGVGNDTFDGGEGDDSLIGGGGDDSYIINTSADIATEIANGGFDTIHTPLNSAGLSAAFDELIFTGTGNFRGIGGLLSNNIVGGAGNDSLSGGAGNDTMHGLSGNDSLFGDIGDDLLAAGAGADSLTGGDGNDIFAAFGQSSPSTALINDFTRGRDKLDLRGMGITTFADVLAYGKTTADGAHSVFTKAGETVTVRWATMASYVESDFVLGAAPSFSPGAVRLSNPDFAENNLAGSTVGILMGQAVRGAALIYTLDDDSSGAFALIGRALVATRPLDYEAQAFHDVVVRATDETGASSSSSIRINIGNTNDAPVMAANAAAVLAENLTGRTVLSLQAADQDAVDNGSGTFNGTFQFATGTNDNAQFSISGANLRYEGEPLNFEDPNSQHSFVVEVQARDQAGALSAPQRISVALADVNEQPTLQVSAAVSFDENTTNGPVALLLASDPDAGDQLTVEFAAGTNDNSLFSLQGNSLYYSGPAIDFETSTTHLFSVQVQVRDASGELSPVSTVAVSVRDVNEAPSLTAPVAATLNEGVTSVKIASLVGSDPDANDQATVQLAGTDNDNAMFAIEGNDLVYTGEILDFEDAAQPKSFKVDVQAIDLDHLTSGLKTINVSVANVNERPSIVSPEFGSFPENSKGVKVATIATQDQDAGDTVTVQFAAGSNDNARFELVGAGLRYIGPAIDYENASAQKQFTVVLQAKDAGGMLSDPWPVLVSVSDVDEAPPPPPNLVLTGTAGNDRIVPGTTQSGQVFQGLGNDSISGLGGNDTIDGGVGADTMYGGTGDDTYTVDNVLDLVREDAKAGTDKVQSLVTRSLENNVENLVLLGSASIGGTGNASANALTGNPGANALSGMAGNDTIVGGAGADSLLGGAGADRLTGGEGADTFVFKTAAEIGTSPSSRDVITDFVYLLDRIDLSAIDAGPAPLNQDFSGVTQSSSLVAGAVTWYVSGGVTIVQGDTDGKTQTAEFRLELTGALSLTAADFIL